MKLAKDN